MYASYLSNFRGFVATYPPCFSLLYRGFPGPTLAICATRYEYPFTHDSRRWRWLNEALVEGVEDGWLSLAANNRADADYVRNYTGLAPTYLPSACSYIDATYTGHRSPAIISSLSEALATAISNTVKAEAIPLRAALGPNYPWSALYDYRALVLIPYNISTMSLFEHYNACMPIYVPSRLFLRRLMAEHPAAVLSHLSFSQIVGAPAAAPRGDGLDLNNMRDGAIIEWYLARADFYDAEWMPHVQQFDSWAHLDHRLNTDDHGAISDAMKRDRASRLNRIARLWDQLDWTMRIVSRGVA